jgi:hypothetical protein
MKPSLLRCLQLQSKLVITLIILNSTASLAQDNVGIGTNTPDASAILEMLSNNKGLLVPRMNTAGMNAITSPANSLLIYNTDSMCYFFYRQPISAWVSLCSSTGGSGTIGFTGATGASGTNGIDGATGVVGATGTAGNNGIDGVTGATGAAGINGIDGVTGATGSAGTNGIDGVTGATGAAGINGIDGVTGATGSTGTNGIDGITGATGAAGINGIDGVTGATGSAGTNGIDGITGATGATGVAGTNGTNGTNGATGATGTNGTNGANGATGATGAAGTNGTNGANGATGATGTAGTNGTNGTNGATGATGAAGINGTNGTNGATGATGAAGINGTNGTNGATGATGAAGINGTNGTNGATGATGAAGTNGTNGTNGATGATGAAGTNGINGTNGATGATGTAGTNGTNGTNGVTGATGAAGAAGATGPTGPTWTMTTSSYDADGNLVINTSIPSTVTSTNRAWLVGGNNFGTIATPYSLGTTSNDHVDLVSSGTVRGRLSNLGEFFIGTTNTTLTGDLMNSVANAVFPWAINGYTNFNGGGVYGAIQGANNTSYAAIQGENNSTTGNINSSGVRGANSSITAGTGFRTIAATGPKMGVTGVIYGAGSYSFGVHGSIPSLSLRTGALFGDDGGIAMGAVGYYASNNNDYSFYAFGNITGLDFSQGGAGGISTYNGTINRSMNGSGLTEPNSMIGLGVYGGVMGGWVRGLEYGFHAKGHRYGLYVDGTTFTNSPITQLINIGENKRVAAKASMAMSADVQSRGKAQLVNGQAFITFSNEFSKIISNPEDLVITVTPNGNTNGVYVSSVSANGFTIKENNEGTSNVSISWIAISTIKGYNDMSELIPSEVAASDFDEKMMGVMFNENNTERTPNALWWDGTQIRFDTPPAKQIIPTLNLSRGQQSGNINR